MNYSNSGIQLELDSSGVISKVVTNDLPKVNINVGTSAVHIFDESSYQTFYDSFSKVSNSDISIGFSGKLNDNTLTFVFMIKHQETISFFAIPTDPKLSSLFDEMVKINNKQVSTIRELYQKLAKFKDPEELLEELMIINNQLINTRRELNQKNKELNRLNQELENVNFKDFLTQLPNRRKFFFDIYSLVKEDDYSLIMTDFNNFKIINDTFGHQKGDELLQYFSKHMSKLIIPYDGVLYRLGGDEFAILIKSEVTFNVIELFNKIDELLLFFHNDISMAYGKVDINKHNVNKSHKAESKMHEADRLMYTMKQKYYSNHKRQR